MTRTETHDWEQTILGENVCLPATVTYEYDRPHNWHPGSSARVTLESITVDGVELLQMFSAKHRARMEADLLRAVQEQQELM